MSFWGWLNKEDHRRFGSTKRILVAILIFLAVPFLVYQLIVWDPVIGYDEDGEPRKLGLYIVVGLYWAGAYMAYKRYEAKSRLNKLLDKILSEDEKEVAHLFEIAKGRRELIKKHRFLTEEGEKRADWFVPE